MNTLRILLYDSPGAAPNYALENPNMKAATLETAVVVGKGTKAGKPTVDLVFKTKEGHTFVAMITGGLILNVAAAVQGMEQRTQPGGPSGG